MSRAPRHPRHKAIFKRFFLLSQKRRSARTQGDPTPAVPLPPQTGLPAEESGPTSADCALRPDATAQAQTNVASRQPHVSDENEPIVLGTCIQTGKPVTVSLKELLQSLYGIGVTGSGKTTLADNMIFAHLQCQRGLCLIEPHGDLTRHVIAAMPEDLLERIVYLDITDSASSFGLNLFEVEPGADLTEIAKVASFVMHVFEKVWQVGPETPRLAQVLRNTTRVLLENPGMTFAEIPLLLWDDGVREKLVRGVTNTQTKLFWHQYNKKAPRDRDELIASTINKVDAYLNEPLIARIVSQSVSTINFRQIMDEGKILLVNLSPQLEEASRLIGAVLIGRLLMAAFSRADTPERERRPFLLFCDEYQRFATADFATLLSEARKFKLSTNLFNQTLEQLDDLNRATALQAGTLVVFRVSGSDSKDLAPSYDTTPTPELVGEEPVRAPVADVISHIVRHGSVNSVLKEFTTDYLLPLESLLQKVAAWPHPFLFGCREFRTGDLIDGRSRINDMLSQAMQQGRADIPLNPLALYTLCALANDGSAEVFRPYLIEEFFRPQEYLGFDISAWWLGKPGFLEETKAIRLLVLQHDKRGFFAVLRNRPPYAPAATAFLRVLKTFRETLAVLAQEPILTDTGLFQPKYQLRTYQDQENLVANELSQLPNYHAKVRLITGEHTIRTNPAPPAVSERKLEARIRAIKQHMLAEGVTKSAVAVEEEVRKRHEALRQRPPGDRPPPLNDNGKRPPTTGRGRSKHPPTND